MDPISQAVSVIIGVFTGAVGLAAATVGEVYVGLTTWVIIAIVFAIFFRPGSLGVLTAAIPFPTILTMLTVAFLIDNWPRLSDLLVNAMVDTGLSLSPSHPTVDFRNIGGILSAGWEVAQPIIDMQRELSWWGDFTLMFISSFALAMVLLAHLVTAILVVFGFLAYYMLSFLAFFLLPFMILKWTAWLAEGALKYIAVSGLSLLGIAVVYGLMGAVVSGLEWSPDLDGLTMFGYASATFLMMCMIAATPVTVAKITGTQNIFSPAGMARNMLMTAAAGGLVGGMFCGGGAVGGLGGMGGAGNPGGMNITGGVPPSGGPSVGGSGASLPRQTGQIVRF
jgi:type IV secretory pathway TrbL component